jgi:hypothetical protein
VERAVLDLLADNRESSAVEPLEPGNSVGAVR